MLLNADLNQRVVIHSQEIPWVDSPMAGVPRKDYIAGEYSIADMACYPWIVPHVKQQQNLDDFPHLKRWFNSIASRQAVMKAYEKGQGVSSQPTVTEESKKILFDQTAANLKQDG